MSRCRRSVRVRRGAATVLVVLLMLIIDVVILGIVLGGSRDQNLTVQRLDTLRAFYAAEGGMNMAIRELMVNDDEDGDGAVGTISNDGDDNNNPSIGFATVSVTSAAGGGGTIYRSRGRAGSARRDIEATVQ